MRREDLKPGTLVKVGHKRYPAMVVAYDPTRPLRSRVYLALQRPGDTWWPWKTSPRECSCTWDEWLAEKERRAKEREEHKRKQAEAEAFEAAILAEWRGILGERLGIEPDALTDVLHFNDWTNTLVLNIPPWLAKRLGHPID